MGYPQIGGTPNPLLRVVHPELGRSAERRIDLTPEVRNPRRTTPDQELAGPEQHRECIYEFKGASRSNAIYVFPIAAQDWLSLGWPRASPGSPDPGDSTPGIGLVHKEQCQLE